MTALAASPTHLPPRVSWGETLARMDWRQGEHVTLIGPTGVGKTELAIALAATRQWGVFLNTKRKDATQHPLKRLGFHRIRHGDDVNPEVASRYVISPRWSRKLTPGEHAARHARAFRAGLTRAFWQGGWTVVIDELEYINRDLGIDSEVNIILRQGRSGEVSLVSGTQRPRHVTLHAYEQAKHLFLWRQADMANIRRAAELAGINRNQVEAVVPGLARHDVLYVNTETGEMFITNTRS